MERRGNCYEATKKHQGIHQSSRKSPDLTIMINIVLEDEESSNEELDASHDDGNKDVTNNIDDIPRN